MKLSDPYDPNHKNQFQQQYEQIVTCFIDEINERFNPKNYEALIEYYENFTSLDFNKELNFNKLKIYENILDLQNLKVELKSFACYKIGQDNVNWNELGILIAHFKEKQLAKFFPEVYKALKLYLSIPATSVTAERSFSCLKLLKTCLRSTMTNDRLNDLGVVKMNNHKNTGFNLNINDIIDNFINLPKNGRRLNLSIQWSTLNVNALNIKTRF